MAYLFITHDLSTVKRIANKVAVMLKGKLVASGPTVDIFRAALSSLYRAASVGGAGDAAGMAGRGARAARGKSGARQLTRLSACQRLEGRSRAPFSRLREKVARRAGRRSFDAEPALLKRPSPALLSQAEEESQLLPEALAMTIALITGANRGIGFERRGNSAGSAIA